MYLIDLNILPSIHQTKGTRRAFPKFPLILNEKCWNGKVLTGKGCKRWRRTRGRTDDMICTYPFLQHSSSWTYTNRLNNNVTHHLPCNPHSCVTKDSFCRGMDMKRKHQHQTQFLCLRKCKNNNCFNDGIGDGVTNLKRWIDL